MKKLISLIKSHKAISITVAAVLSLAIVGGVGFGLYQAKYGATNLAAKYAAKGYITPEEMEEIEASGNLVLGEEIADAEGNIIILEKDKNGNIISHVVGRQEGKTPSSEPGHSHIWVAHYATRTVPQTQTITHPAITHTESWWKCHCGAEGKNGDGSRMDHLHSGCHQSYGNITKTIVDSPAWTETVTTQVTEQYIDYYYCSECGARQ